MISDETSKSKNEFYGLFQKRLMAKILFSVTKRFIDAQRLRPLTNRFRVLCHTGLSNCDLCLRKILLTYFYVYSLLQ